MFGGVLAFVLVLVGILILALGPRRHAACAPGAICLGPPVGQPLLGGEKVWKSALGFRVEYDTGSWSVLGSPSANGLALEFTDGSRSSMTIDGAPSGVSPLALLAERLAQLKGGVASLAPDCVLVVGTPLGTDCRHPEDAILSPNIGYVRGVGGAWAGTSNEGSQLSEIIIAATNGRVSVLITVSTTLSGGTGCVNPQSIDECHRYHFMSRGDTILNDFLWPGVSG